MKLLKKGRMTVAIPPEMDRMLDRCKGSTFGESAIPLEMATECLKED